MIAAVQMLPATAKVLLIDNGAIIVNQRLTIEDPILGGVVFNGDMQALGAAIV